ncbi:MAG TPA: Flp pilus assembly protein CpaB, partial [Magnetospirillum sp.]|nr:Flp pilus assembly protein CpaB [Magnetospirillum sp.]
LVAVSLVKSLQTAPPPHDGMKVVVATATMRFGDQLLPGNVRLVDFAAASAPEDAFHSIEELVGGEPRYALETIRASEPVLHSKVTGKGGKASLSSVIDQAKRAVTIRVDDVFGVAGFITPADHVDVMLTSAEDPQRPNDNPKTAVLLQNVKVLAIDQKANEHEGKPSIAKAVTLEVTPEEAQKLALGRTIGTLSLALRNFTDPQPVNSRMISIADLSGGTPAKAAPRSVGPGLGIDVIRGTETIRVGVRDDGSAVASASKRR